ASFCQYVTHDKALDFWVKCVCVASAVSEIWLAFGTVCISVSTTTRGNTMKMETDEYRWPHLRGSRKNGSVVKELQQTAQP
ncbi:hypothetical protein ABG768_003815, partial [Culter alburnus]